MYWYNDQCCVVGSMNDTTVWGMVPYHTICYHTIPAVCLIIVYDRAEVTSCGIDRQTVIGAAPKRPPSLSA